MQLQRDEKRKEKKELGLSSDKGESNLPPEMLKAGGERRLLSWCRYSSEATVLLVNPKKLYSKAEFAGRGGFVSGP